PLLTDVGDKILFKAFCALADGAVSPIASSVKHFREEYEAHVTERRCPFTDRPPLARATGREGAEGRSILVSEVLP
ncbi:MAG: hypothetical protein HY658_01960, partial [Actinobacteria bacterium]|nr:hypothetical protein [Actinomycetota bacterium]